MYRYVSIALLLASSTGCGRKKEKSEDYIDVCFDKKDNDNDGKVDCLDDSCVKFCDGAQQYR